MNEVKKQVSSGQGYQMLDKEIEIIYYTDDTVPITENVDDLQKSKHRFMRQEQSLT